MENYVELILNYIKTHKITAKQIEIDCGLANGTISKWKKGKNGARKENVLKVINYLGIEIDKIQLSNDEEKLIETFRELSKNNKLILINEALKLYNDEYITEVAARGDSEKKVRIRKSDIEKDLANYTPPDKL